MDQNQQQEGMATGGNYEDVDWTTIGTQLDAVVPDFKRLLIKEILPCLNAGKPVPIEQLTRVFTKVSTHSGSGARSAPTNNYR